MRHVRTTLLSLTHIHKTHTHTYTHTHSLSTHTHIHTHETHTIQLSLSLSVMHTSYAEASMNEDGAGSYSLIFGAPRYTITEPVFRPSKNFSVT